MRSAPLSPSRLLRGLELFGPQARRSCTGRRRAIAAPEHIQVTPVVAVFEDVGCLAQGAERVFAGDQEGPDAVACRCACLLYTSDAADDLLCVDLGGRRIIKKKNNKIVNDAYFVANKIEP